MRIKFTRKEEFLHELFLEKSSVKDQILRLTCEYKPAHHAPNVFLVTVIAGVVVRGALIELRQFCGDMLNIPARKKEAQQRADRIMEEVTTQAGQMGFEVRSGIYEP